MALSAFILGVIILVNCFSHNKLKGWHCLVLYFTSKEREWKEGDSATFAQIDT